MSSLYEINSEIVIALANAELEAMENDGELAEATCEELDRLEMDRELKIENTALYIKNLKAESAMIKAEEKKLKERRQIVDNKLANISEWLKFNLHGEKRAAGNYKISYRNSKATSIENIELIPAEYIITKTTEMPDKTAIKKAILAGEEVSGAVVVEKSNMEVK